MILEDNPGRRPQTVGGIVYLVVLSIMVTGLAVVLAGAWRPGVSWLGVGLLLGAGTRLVLSEQRAGMLRVRRKPADVLMLSAAGLALIVLAVVVPDQPR